MVTSKALRTWLTQHRACRQVVIDPDGAWNEPTSGAEVIARADPKLLFESFAQELEWRRDRSWLEEWRQADAAASRAIVKFLRGLGAEPFEPRVHRRLATVLPPLSTVFVASSMPVRELESFLPKIDRPVRFLANRGANGIDGLVSSGLGAAAVAPGRTFLLLGDLALYHDMNGLLAYGRGGLEATVAGLYGIPHRLVTSQSRLDAALDGPGIAEIRLDRARNVELHRALFAHVEQ